MVCRPFLSPALTSPVAMMSSSTSALINVDLPAPDSPSSAMVFPASINSLISSKPSVALPLSATTKIGLSSATALMIDFTSEISSV